MAEEAHAPFMRDGAHVPVQYAPPFPDEPEVAPVAPQQAERNWRPLIIAASIMLLVALVFGAQQWLRPTRDTWTSPQLVAGLDDPPTVRDGWHAFCSAGTLDIGANVVLGGRTVKVRAMSRTGGTVWEVEVAVGHEVAAVELADRSEAGEVVLRVTPPHTVGMADEDLLVALSLSDGAERMRRHWPATQGFLGSDDGRLYRLHGTRGVLQAMESLEVVRWERELDAYMWLGGPIELRSHAGLVLLTPTQAMRRVNASGSDTFVTGFDPATGEIPQWLDDGLPYQRFHRYALDDVYIEANIGGGERSITARSWLSGEVRWQRFDVSESMLAVGGSLYLLHTWEEGVRLTRVGAADGRDVWRAEIPHPPSVAMADDEALYLDLGLSFHFSSDQEDEAAHTVDATVLAIDLETGHTEEFSYLPEGEDTETWLRRSVSSPVYLGEGRFFVAGIDDAGQSTITARSTVDGTPEWSRTHEGFDGVQQVGDRLLLVNASEERIAPLR